MDRIALKEKSKEQIKGKIAILFLCTLIYTFISTLFSFIPLAGPIVGAVLILPVLAYGLYVVFLDVTLENEIKIETLFSGFSNFKNVWCMQFLMSLYVTLGSLLLIVPGIVMSYAYSFAPYILAENPQLSGREALRLSKEMTDGHKWDLFILQLSFLGWELLGVVTFGIAYIYVVPYINVAYANAYNRIKEEFNPEF